MEYRVSKFVAQGACQDFRRAYENANPELKAARPSFKRKNRLARPPPAFAHGWPAYQVAGSVKLVRLPDGIPYEVRISRQNAAGSVSTTGSRPSASRRKPTSAALSMSV